MATGVPRFFADLESAISLLGPYAHVKRAVAHHLLGATLMPTIIQHGRTYTDTRVPLMVAIESGHGKGEIERGIRTYADGGRPLPLLSYEKPTTRHEQQLLGYVSWKKDKEEESGGHWEMHKGFMSKDLLMLNEAYGEMADPLERDFRAFMNTALDPYGRNEVFKQNLREGELRYMPTVSPCVMMQEQPVPADVWYSGSSRRYLWVVAERITAKQRYKIMHEAVTGSSVPLMSIETHDAGWRIRFKATKPPGYKIDFGGVTNEVLQAWVAMYDLFRENVQRFRSLPNSMMFNLRDLIYKLTTNYAVARADEMDKLSGLKIEIDINDINLALADLSHFVPAMARYLDQHLVPAELRFLSPISRQIVSIIAKYGPLHQDEVATYLEMYGVSYPGAREHIFRELMVLRLIGVVRARDDGKDEVPGSSSDIELREEDVLG